MKDPFNPQQSVIFKIEKERPVVFSIGPNLTDDQGKPRAPIGEGDLVWRYELPDGFSYDEYILY